MQRAHDPKRYRFEFTTKDSQSSIKKLYGDCKSGGYTTNNTEYGLIETKLCCDTDTKMVYYSFERKGKVYPLAPYLKEGKFVKILEVPGYDNTYVFASADF